MTTLQGSPAQRGGDGGLCPSKLPNWQARLPHWNEEDAPPSAFVAATGNVTLVACCTHPGHFTASMVELSPDGERITADFTRRGVECAVMWPTITAMCGAMTGAPSLASFELVDSGSLEDLWPVMPQAARRVVAAWPLAGDA